MSHLPRLPSVSTPEQQVEAARRAILAVASPELATLTVTGKDRVSWLNGLVTCDLAGWGEGPTGEARYGLVVSRSGRVLADPILVADGDRVVAVVVAPLVDRLREHLDHYLVMEDAEVASGSAFEVWMVHGPSAASELTSSRAAGATAGGFDRTGLGGAIVLAPLDRAAAVRIAVESAASDARGVVGDGHGWDALRLERGIPRFGVDFDDKTYPQEASLEKAAVSFNKGCYLGQEVVCMLEMRGHVKRKLVSIVLDVGDAERSGAGSVVSDEAGIPVGEVTSLALSPTLGVPVGLAMLKRAQAVAGSRVVVGGAGAANATVVECPA
jgi:folate-binding protein YgfZ